MSAGTLAIVGVGPGDPDLLTHKATACLASAKVVAYPSTHDGSFSARIAAAHIGHAQHLPFTIPMTGDGAAEPAYDCAAKAIAAHLEAGTDVALLCEGDPMLYGSAASIADRLSSRFPLRIIPGVIAASASAAVASRSLVRGTDVFSIVPATASQAVLRKALQSGAALAIYKVGRHFDAVASAIRKAGRDAVLVERATLAEQVITPLCEAPPGKRPYFSTVLVAASKPITSPADGAVAVLALSAPGLTLAARLARHLDANGQSARTHGLATRTDGADVPFADAMHHISGLFRSGTPIVAVASSGILIRAVAPFLEDKHTEPPVISVAEDGSAVVPLLGAHNGGAALSRIIADHLGAAPAFTTRSEAVLGQALDDPPEGFVVADPAPFKALAATTDPDGPGTADPALTFLPRPDGWPVNIAATTRIPTTAHTTPTYIVKRIAVGMGAERGASPENATALIKETLADCGIDPRAVACLASLDVKADEVALQEAASSIGVPFRVFDRDTLAAQEEKLATPSAVVKAAVGVSGVAEASALAAAGNGGRLIAEKRVAGQLTIAIAEAEKPIVPLPGRTRGHLAVVGIGPGAHAWRTSETLALLAQADCFVGYTLYLDLVEDLRGSRPRHDFPLGGETERTRFALEEAGKGKTVALISSGDAGIYAMASLAAELLDGDSLSEPARRVELTIAPGISAAQAAAARVGAPLGHDFAFISLSDLLTPWDAIERRLSAAANADFVTALYNPRSQRRTRQLEAAAEIFRAVRPAETPVIIASRIGREDEGITHTTLRDFRPEDVDMLSTVLIGASTTRRFIRGDGRAIVYTPRGYGANA